jgi:hypothetical protein
MEIEYTPVIIAWEAITDAAAASTTNGYKNPAGASRKNGFVTAEASLSTNAPWPK